MANSTVARGRGGDCADDALFGARRALQIGDKPLAAACLEMFAVAAAEKGDHHRAAAMLAACDAVRREMGAEPDPDEQAVRGEALKLLDQRGEAFALGTAQGRELDLPGAFALATAADGSSA